MNGAISSKINSSPARTGGMDAPTKITSPSNYNANAQTFIKSARSKGYSVKAEGTELIASKSSSSNPQREAIAKSIKNAYTNIKGKTFGTGWGP